VATGQCIEDLATHLFALVPIRIINKRTVSEALTNSRWTRDLHGVFSAPILYDLLLLADLISEVTLQRDQPDRHV
jgi:hypothetical protein